MLKNIWISYQRYKSSQKRKATCLNFGVIGALSETFSIYLRNTTNLDKNKLIININF